MKKAALPLICCTDVSGHGDIVIGASLLDGIAFPRVGHTAEHVFLGIDVACVSGTDAIVIAFTREKAVHNVYLSEAHTGHTLVATLIPPAVGKGGAQMSAVFGIVVAAAPKAAVAMVGRTARTTGVWLDEIAETAPSDGYMVGAVVAVEVAVYPILEVTVVYPDIVGILELQVIVTINVISSRTLESKVTQDDVPATAERQDARLAYHRTMDRIAQHSPRQAINCLVGSIFHRLHATESDRAFHVNGLLTGARESSQQVGLSGHDHTVFVTATRDCAANSGPSNGRILVVDRQGGS